MLKISSNLVYYLVIVINDYLDREGITRKLDYYKDNGVNYSDAIKLYGNIEYYNNYRYQWNLKKMTPVQYRNHLFESIA